MSTRHPSSPRWPKAPTTTSFPARGALANRSSLAAAFAGERALFTAHDGSDGTAPRPALYLADHWDWEQRYPVVRISFGQGIRRFPEELDEAIAWQLETNAARLNVPISQAHGIAERFADLITAAAEAYRQRTVVLVDEYDKPILDHITRPDLAAAMRERLRNFYSVLKKRDADLHFVFLTGVSKFSKVSLFSGLNNLADITLIDEFATLCGYTESDLDTVFAPEFVAAEQEGCPLSRSEVRAWYNGYWWRGNARVYNPFDVLQLLRFRTFRPWWFESGTPTFLVELLKERAFFTPPARTPLCHRSAPVVVRRRSDRTRSPPLADRLPHHCRRPLGWRAHRVRAHAAQHRSAHRAQPSANPRAPSFPSG